jgi:hypothetical protein
LAIIVVKNASQDIAPLDYSFSWNGIHRHGTLLA